jgi:hypothetical protein
VRQKAAAEAAAAEPPAASSSGDAARVPATSCCDQTWAILIKRVYEVDALACPLCGGAMKVIAPLLQSPSPIQWPAVQMHHGNRIDAIGIYPINDSKRKVMKSMLANISYDHAKCLRCPANPRKPGFDFIEKAGAETGLLFVVPFSGGDNLLVGIGVVDRGRHWTRSRARRMTSSAGTH